MDWPGISSRLHPVPSVQCPGKQARTKQLHTLLEKNKNFPLAINIFRKTAEICFVGDDNNFCYEDNNFRATKIINSDKSGFFWQKCKNCDAVIGTRTEQTDGVISTQVESPIEHLRNSDKKCLASFTQHYNKIYDHYEQYYLRSVDYEKMKGENTEYLQEALNIGFTSSKRFNRVKCLCCNKKLPWELSPSETMKQHVVDSADCFAALQKAYNRIIDIKWELLDKMASLRDIWDETVQKCFEMETGRFCCKSCDCWYCYSFENEQQDDMETVWKYHLSRTPKCLDRFISNYEQLLKMNAPEPEDLYDIKKRFFKALMDEPSPHTNQIFEWPDAIAPIRDYVACDGDEYPKGLTTEEEESEETKLSYVPESSSSP